MRITEDLVLEWLKQPAGTVAAEIVRLRQQAVRKAEKRLLALHATKTAADPEALHDFRVEVRRLRVWLKATADLINTRKAERARLRTLAKATNPARDHEVMQDLLRRCAQAPERAETAEIMLELLARHAPAKAEWSRDGLDPPHLKPRKGKKPQPQFGVWLSEQLAELLDTFDQQLAAGDEALHMARIQGKHLRYLIEPFGQIAAARDAVVALKEFQTDLGDIHDLVVLRQHLPLIAQWQLEERLPPVLAHHGKQTRPLQQAFGQARNHTTLLADWQWAEYQAHVAAFEQKRPERSARLHEQITRLIALLEGRGPPSGN